MKENFPAYSILEYQKPVKITDAAKKTGGFNDYMEEFKLKMKTKMDESLENVKQSNVIWDKDSGGFGIEGKHMDEILQHSEWDHTKCLTFFGREILSNKVISLIAATKREEDPNTSDRPETYNL